MSSKENVNQFYGVSLAIDSNLDQNQLNETELIFTDKTQALNTVKKFKGSRFKAFSNRNDAILFSKEKILTEVNSNDKNSLAKNVEKSLSPFNSPHTRDLTKLRRAIEKADYETVEQLIWSNPRYLVSSGDTPVILMEGPRYNACHIAAKESKHTIIKLILNTVSDQNFWKLLFPFDQNDVTESRIDFLLDLYLNTPDKGFCETPLHFGCKFGSLETVSVLLSFPNCDLEKQNKFGLKPSEIVCERKGDKSVKSEILKLFEARLYIPLLRDDFSAQIGEPFEGRIEDKRVSGLAGPMSPQQADALYNALKSPRKCTPREKRIRLTDPQKGLERIARFFCEEMNVKWIEFWPFLNTCINLSSDEGLNLLEHHLRDVYFRLDSSESKHQSLVWSQNNNNNKISLLCNELSKLNINLFGSSEVTNEIEKKGLTDVLQSDKPFFSISNIADEDEEDESFYESDDSDDSYTTAPDTPQFLFDFYINGSKITKEDIDAALAIQHKINDDICLQMDFIQNWFFRVKRERPQHFNDANCDLLPSSLTPIK